MIKKMVLENVMAGISFHNIYSKKIDKKVLFLNMKKCYFLVTVTVVTVIVTVTDILSRKSTICTW
nr:MAG: hypothetical protein [Lokiarchaeota virus Ratatoskr Meg22_1012]